MDQPGTVNKKNKKFFHSSQKKKEISKTFSILPKSINLSHFQFFIFHGLT